MSQFISFLAPGAAVLALGTAVFLIFSILKKDEGTDRMKEIAAAVREGASAYLTSQYKWVAIFFAAVFAILLFLSLRGYLVIFVPFAFLTGGFFSGLSGFCGMKIATASSARTANACRTSLNGGLRLAFSSGAVMGFSVVGFALLNLTAWYFFLRGFYSSHPLPEGIASGDVAITSVMLTVGLGASFLALFARVGGGIFTKAADVGADLVGKVEAGIPEDDPRNPAVIADNVGDNVGDVAGMGADLFESYVGSIVASAALGVAAGYGVQGLMLPMVIAAMGILSSFAGMFFVRTTEDATQKTLLKALHKGVNIASVLVGILVFVVIKYWFPGIPLKVAFSVMTGLVAGLLIGLVTEYFTSSHFSPTKKVAKASETGPATVIIEGLSLGMLSTVIPVLIVAVAIFLSYWLGGLFGIGIAAVGMLSTLGITLATDAYGPVADNAGGNAEMAGLEPEVRKRTDALDSLGNTTAATGKGFAIGSAALTALALIASFKEKILLEVAASGMIDFDFNLNLMNPPVLIGLFIGVAMPYLFSALTMSAVGRAAGQIVFEVRRQFKEIAGIMEGTGKPDYASCVNIVTKSALKEMILPAMLAILTPIVVGILLGVNSLGGLLMGATASGFVLAVMMANSGGAWDNAKKYIEEGNLGGKGSACHKATVVGDTVGDPFKDTSGPSINILIKLMSMVSIVFAAFILKNALMQ
ncbi:MAG: sodium-translocating pyrophosphatase [Candidatus Aceula meridiana]|nr:sodium-translocating pyrophosphatase [Candidatus Aceula meridiana]